MLKRNKSTTQGQNGIETILALCYYSDITGNDTDNVADNGPGKASDW